ncbi:MAG: hypothetical protein GX905_05980 [Bacteroidales bacterium]|nr:hypothetical protein [Bacteroidales bacterium]
MQTIHEINTIIKAKKQTQEPSFPPQSDKVYGVNNRISILVDKVYITRRVDEWLTDDPLSLAKVKHEYKFELEPHLNRILFERLRRIPNEEKKFLGLELNIDFPGYDAPIPASIPYNRYPLKFYKWWIENQDLITLSFKERLSLIDQVNMIDKSALLPKHQALMNR